MSRLVLLALLACGTAAAQTGTFSVSGTNADGSAYGGAVTITAQGETYRVVWETGGEPVEGIGVAANGVLAVAYGGACGVVAYVPDGGDYSAVWATMGGTDLGTEVARLDGDVYRVAGTNPGGGGAYTGTLTMAAGDAATRVHWTVGPSTYDGLGLKLDDVLGIAYGDPTCGVAVYHAEDGVLEGVWAIPGMTDVGTETLMPQ